MITNPNIPLREFFVERSFDQNMFSLYGRQTLGGMTYEMTSIMLNKLEEGAMTNPMVQITPEEASKLMDELWNAGVRPSNGEGNVGQIGAIRAHLEDMRKIAFSYLELQK